MTTTERDPIVQTDSLPDLARPQKKTWQVGTLTYTAGGLVVLFCWLLWGDFAISLRDRSIHPIVKVLLRKYGATDLLFGILLTSLPSFLGFFLGPVISYKSDRYRSRWGRRIPFLMVIVPLSAISAAGLAFSPLLAGALHNALGNRSPGLEAITLATLTVFWSVYELISISGFLVGALINDVVPSQMMGRFTAMYRIIGLIAGIMFNWYLMGHAEKYYFWMLIGFALLFGVSCTLMLLNVKEGAYPPPAPVSAPKHVKPGLLSATKDYLRICFSNSYYSWFFVSVTLAGLAPGPVNIYDVKYTHSIGMSDDAYGKCLSITYCISILLAFPIGYLADKFHPLRVTIAVVGLYALASVYGVLFAGTPLGFSIAFIGHGVAAGCFATATSSLGPRLLPRSTYATVNSAGATISAVCWMVMPILLGMFLDRTGHVYRFTFVVGAILSSTSLILLFVLHSKFMKLGGPKNYVAPE